MIIFSAQICITDYHTISSGVHRYTRNLSVSRLFYLKSFVCSTYHFQEDCIYKRSGPISLDEVSNNWISTECVKLFYIISPTLLVLVRLAW